MTTINQAILDNIIAVTQNLKGHRAIRLTVERSNNRNNSQYEYQTADGVWLVGMVDDYNERYEFWVTKKNSFVDDLEKIKGNTFDCLKNTVDIIMERYSSQDRFSHRMYGAFWIFTIWNDGDYAYEQSHYVLTPQLDLGLKGSIIINEHHRELISGSPQQKLKTKDQYRQQAWDSI